MDTSTDPWTKLTKDNNPENTATGVCSISTSSGTSGDFDSGTGSYCQGSQIGTYTGSLSPESLTSVFTIKDTNEVHLVPHVLDNTTSSTGETPCIVDSTKIIQAVYKIPLDKLKDFLQESTAAVDGNAPKLLINDSNITLNTVKIPDRITIDLKKDASNNINSSVDPLDFSGNNSPQVGALTNEDTTQAPVIDFLLWLYAWRTYQDKLYKEFGRSVSAVWTSQARLPNEWNKFFKSIYGEGNTIIKELTERDISQKQLEYDKIINDQVVKYHYLTDLIIQTKYSSERSESLDNIIRQQKEGLEKDIKKASGDVTSQDRQIQINYNEYYKVLDKSRRLKVVFIATILSIIMVCLGLLKIGVSFNVAVASICFFYLFSFHLISKMGREGERSEQNFHELQFKPLTDNQMKAAADSTERTNKCTIGGDECGEEDTCYNETATASGVEGQCVKKDSSKGQQSDREKMLMAELAKLQKHHDNANEPYH